MLNNNFNYVIKFGFYFQKNVQAYPNYYTIHYYIIVTSIIITHGDSDSYLKEEIDTIIVSLLITIKMRPNELPKRCYFSNDRNQIEVHHGI